MDTKAIEVQVNRVTRELTPDELEEIDLAVNSLYRIAGEIRKTYRERMLEVVLEHGPVVVGTTKYWAGNRKDTDCINEPLALESLLVAAEGDLSKVTAALAAKAFKHGYCRGVLPPEVYDLCFKTEERPVLKEDGTAVKQLQSVDTTFLDNRR